MASAMLPPSARLERNVSRSRPLSSLEPWYVITGAVQHAAVGVKRPPGKQSFAVTSRLLGRVVLRFPERHATFFALAARRCSTLRLSA